MRAGLGMQGLSSAAGRKELGSGSAKESTRTRGSSQLAAGRGLFFFVWFPFLLPQPSLSGQPGLSGISAPSSGPARSPHSCSWRQTRCVVPDTTGFGITDSSRVSLHPSWTGSIHKLINEMILFSPRSACSSEHGCPNPAVLSQLELWITQG